MIIKSVKNHNWLLTTVNKNLIRNNIFTVSKYLLKKYVFSNKKDDLLAL